MAHFDLPGKIILLHNRHGIRIELVFNKTGELHLWFSPRADSSADQRYRNFSNRDDHMPIFDKITLEGLTEDDFEGCEYDAFYSVIRFKEQVLHVASVYDRPAVMLWAEREQAVDLKSDRTDSLVEQSDEEFAVRHAERGEDLEFRALLGEGPGFRHQSRVEPGRSIYARAELEANQTVFFGADVAEKSDALAAMLRELRDQGVERVRDADEQAIEAAVSKGALELREAPELQDLLHRNKRTLLAMQDALGAIRAAMNRIYYLIWVRDGAIIECFLGHHGQSEPVKLWAEYLLANPLEIKEPGYEGRTYGQLVNPISKWQEDGFFYAVWSVFERWTQAGQEPAAGEVALLEEVAAWFEKYCYDEEQKLFGRFYACETPLKGSHDYGFDGAVGKPTPIRGCKKWDGEPVVQSFDIYVNHLNFNAYLMLAAMTEGSRRQEHLDKARSLAEAMKPYFEPELPDYGDLRLESGRLARADSYGIDRTDYQWSITVTPFSSEPDRVGAARQRIYEKIMDQPGKTFLAAYFSVMQALDPLDTTEAEIHKAITYAEKQCHRPGKYLAMPHTVVEMLDVEDGNLGHDVRPQAFSIGPFLATVTGLGLRRQPFGLALRPNETLSAIRDYQYLGKELTVRFEPGAQFTLNGDPVSWTWQIPEDLLRETNEIRFPSAKTAVPASLCWLGSTLRLNTVHESGGAVIYEAEAYGWNSVRLALPDGATVKVEDAERREIATQTNRAHGSTWVRFEGDGPVRVTIL